MGVRDGELRELPLREAVELGEFAVEQTSGNTEHHIGEGRGKELLHELTFQNCGNREISKAGKCASDQPGFLGDMNRAGSAIHAKLRENVHEVAFHGRLGNKQIARDLFVL